MKPTYGRSNDGLDELRRDPSVGQQSGGGTFHVPSLDPADPEMAALEGLSTQMRRGRFMDALPEEEQGAIRIIISPGGGVQIEGGDEAEGGPDDNAEEEAQEVSTGGEGAPALHEEEMSVPGADDEEPAELTGMMRRR